MPGIMTDRRIKKLSQYPTHMLCDEFCFPVRPICAPFTDEEAWAVGNWSSENQSDHILGLPYAYPLGEDSPHVQNFKPMIEPFLPSLIRKVDDQKVISFGVSSMGYDVRLSSKELKLFTNVWGAEIDPMEIDVDKCFVTPVIRTCEKKGLKYVLIPPNSYLLGHTVEYFRIPRNCLVICLGKSTYARAAVAVNVTPIEPGFEGNVVLEIANHSNLPARVYLDCGVSQFVFFESEEECEVSYADRAGKYQHQTGLTHARV